MTRTLPRVSVSVTLPRLASHSSSTRAPRAGRARRPPSARRRTTRPGARTTTTTPIRMRTATPGPDRGRVVSSTSASWSPGSARGGRRAEMMSDRLAPAPRTKRAGRTASHDVAARPADRATRGCPRRSRENPARSASTPTALWLGFATRMVALPAPSSERRAGVADRASGGRVVPVPAEAGTGTSRSTTAGSTRHAARVIGRWP